MADHSLGFSGGFVSLASDPSTKKFGSSARPVYASEQYADYDFIAMLGLAQRLHIRFLPITWQAPLGQMGKGGQAGINEALVNAQISFAFKLFNRPQRHPFREIAQEMVVLSHPMVRQHKHIITLEGICWDIPEDNQVWPVLVFEKSHLGDLHRFARLERFKDLSIEDKLNLCADVGLAIRDMHRNGIVHGDIKPWNILIFEEGSRIITKVADFGFATCFQSHNDWISMPDIGPWNAPEHHDRSFRPEQAKQMDVYSFGLLCFWLIFKAGSSDDLPLPPDTIIQSGQLVSFERDEPETNLLQAWKGDNRLVKWLSWLVQENDHFDSSTKNHLVSFFRSTLAFEPQSRCTELEQLLGFLAPNRILPQTKPLQISSIPEQEALEIPSSIFAFYDADYRLREFTVNCLKSAVTESTKSIIQHISLPKTALQLALCYTIGFGTSKDDKQATSILRNHSLEDTDLQSQIQLIVDDVQGASYESGLFPTLQRQGTIQYIDLPHYYREKRLLERAEINYRREIQSIQLVFGQSHQLCLNLNIYLASMYWQQGHWKEAEELQVRVMEISKEVLGEEHPDTLTSMAYLALTYRYQGRWKEAEELEVPVMEMKKVLGEEHPETLTSMASLALTYEDQGRWKEAEELQVRVMETRKKLLGEEHSKTLSSMANLASTYKDQGRWKEAEDLEVQVTETSKKVLGEEHPSTLTCIANLASTYRHQGRWKEAEEREIRVMEMKKKVLGEEHPSTLTSIASLALTYKEQERCKEAEELEVPVMETSKKVLGEKHPDTLISMVNLASTYADQGRWTKAEELEVRVMETKKKVLGEEHPDTLTSIANLASTYEDQGRWTKAEELEVLVMETNKKVLGEEHPSTLTSMANLALTYKEQERWKEAEELEVSVTKIRKKVLGEEHFETLISMANLASTYRSQRCWNEAEKLEMRVMKTRKRVLDEEHPDMLSSIANLASTYRNQGRWREAEVLQVQVIETSKKVLGEEHPDTLISMANLASTYRDQGRWKEAEELEVPVIEMKRKVLGEEHPGTLSSIANLASTYWNQGRWKEAEELEVRVTKTSKKVLGEEHPDTLSSMANLAFTLKYQNRNKEAISLMKASFQLQKQILGPSHPNTRTSLESLNEWEDGNIHISE